MNLQQRPFSGAKIILHHQGALLTYLRDEMPGLPFPAMWDLPGGGAERGESPRACALRETFEEFGLTLDGTTFHWTMTAPSVLHPGKINWYFAAPIIAQQISGIRFGEEGQRWQMMAIEDYLRHPRAVPHLADIVRRFTQRQESRPPPRTHRRSEPGEQA